MSVKISKPFVFTGWHMVLTMISFFGVIIAVNFTMAYLATSSWSGLVVGNTYVASQQFNGKTAEIRAMLATGISGTLDVSPEGAQYRLTMPDGSPVLADRVTAHFKRPVGAHQDFEIALQPVESGVYAMQHPVLAGSWIVELKAEKDGKLIMHEAQRVSVSGE